MVLTAAGACYITWLTYMVSLLINLVLLAYVGVNAIGLSDLGMSPLRVFKEGLVAIKSALRGN